MHTNTQAHVHKHINRKIDVAVVNSQLQQLNDISLFVKLIQKQDK